jgi:hypothetical protein
MNILKGTFRLSIVAAFAAASFTAWQDFKRHDDERQTSLRMQQILRCGAKLPSTIIQQNMNQYGNVDIGKLGCSDQEFLANESEMKAAWSGSEHQMFAVRSEPFYLEKVLGSALILFVITNLLGLLLMLSRKIFIWIAAGFQEKT